MNCPACGLPPTCQECKGAEREVERLQAKVEDLTNKLWEAQAETDNEVQDARDEMTAEQVKSNVLAIDLMNNLLTLVDGIMTGTERYPELEVPRLRKRVETWIAYNT